MPETDILQGRLIVPQVPNSRGTWYCTVIPDDRTLDFFYVQFQDEQEVFDYARDYRLQVERITK